MANAKKCDRCGAFYLTEEVSFPLVPIEGKQRQITTIGNSYYDVDLCPACWENFEKWWKEVD